MKTTRSIECPRCEGEGEIVQVNGVTVYCPTCLGLRRVSEQIPPGAPAEEEDSWYRDPQPARLGRAER
jgi:DnaJ-class molecular chaperone